MKVLLLTLGLLFSLSKANACECTLRGSFLEVAPKTRLVAHVKILKQLNMKDEPDSILPLKIKAEIIQIYRGKEKRHVINILGSRGKDCRMQASQLKEGETFIVALESNEIVRKDGNSDYYISTCGTHLLQVETIDSLTYAVGDIGNNKAKLRLEDVKKILSQ
ncbi:hypothetical protein [Rufibacter sp. XAAS-G3-1]|uniref:hypothetical protein n=1 Tax=Rufibacter sp. XAAS-G3-1 TaxID=2729134 RepID=UPI0015E75993|nr:hypothetical protein [Rufibacter sp. XAAS-G3-1]